MIFLILVISLLALAFSGYLARYVLSQDRGTVAMQQISDAIREGAEAFLKRQYKTIAIFSIILAALIFILYWVVRGEPGVAWRTTVAFLLGAGSSALAGYIGMYFAVACDIRTSRDEWNS